MRTPLSWFSGCRLSSCTVPRTFSKQLLALGENRHICWGLAVRPTCNRGILNMPATHMELLSLTSGIATWQTRRPLLKTNRLGKPTFHLASAWAQTCCKMDCCWNIKSVTWVVSKWAASSPNHTAPSLCLSSWTTRLRAVPNGTSHRWLLPSTCSNECGRLRICLGWRMTYKVCARPSGGSWEPTPTCLE